MEELPKQIKVMCSKKVCSPVEPLREGEKLGVKMILSYDDVSAGEEGSSLAGARRRLRHTHHSGDTPQHPVTAATASRPRTISTLAGSGRIVLDPPLPDSAAEARIEFRLGRNAVWPSRLPDRKAWNGYGAQVTTNLRARLFETDAARRHGGQADRQTRGVRGRGREAKRAPFHRKHPSLGVAADLRRRGEHSNPRRPRPYFCPPA